MIRIAIVDDKPEMLNVIRQKIELVDNLEDIVEIRTFTNPNIFLENIIKGTHYDILFLDIEMKEMNGIDLGVIVKKKRPELKIVFITAHAKYAAKSYAIGAQQYILKQQIDLRISSVLKGLVTQICEERGKYLVVGVHNEIQRIEFKDIIYVKKIKSGKYVEYYTTKGIFRDRIPLKDAGKILNSASFALVERGYIVNIEHVVRMSDNVLYLDNHEEVPMSRARVFSVKKQMFNWWKMKRAYVG